MSPPSICHMNSEFICAELHFLSTSKTRLKIENVIDKNPGLKAIIFNLASLKLLVIKIVKLLQ